METLAKLTRRQVDAMRVILAQETPGRGAPLGSVAAGLHVSAPSALGHLTQLEGLELITRYRGKSRLTPKGRSTLVEYQRHHRIAENLFRGLGLTPDEVCRAAREVDLALSHRMIEKVCDAEGHPSVCPHGQPITPCSTRKGAGAS
jgi:DtxR family transcriptional regulator, Mn-dependent transcriptional regulator